MMDGWGLPTSLPVGGTQRPIRTDYRVILDIMAAFSDPELNDAEKWEACLVILYRYPNELPRKHIQEAIEQAAWFINGGEEQERQPKPVKLMDWEQDAHILIPAVNRSLGYEIRSRKYLHWWTFLSGYMEIRDGLYSQVLQIRIKRSKGKKLEKWEREFLNENKDLIVLKERYTEAEKAEQEALLALLDGAGKDGEENGTG